MSLYKEYIESTTKGTVIEGNDYFIQFLPHEGMLYINHIYGKNPYRLYKILMKQAVGYEQLVASIFKDNPIFNYLKIMLEKHGWILVTDNGPSLLYRKEL